MRALHVEYFPCGGGRPGHQAFKEYGPKLTQKESLRAQADETRIRPTKSRRVRNASLVDSLSHVASVLASPASSRIRLP
jgi:hypothetical protein